MNSLVIVEPAAKAKLQGQVLHGVVASHAHQGEKRSGLLDSPTWRHPGRTGLYSASTVIVLVLMRVAGCVLGLGAT